MQSSLTEFYQVHPAYSTYVHFYSGLCNFIRSQSLSEKSPTKLDLLKRALRSYEEASGFLHKAKEVEDQDVAPLQNPSAESHDAPRSETSDKTYTVCSAASATVSRDSLASASTVATAILGEPSSEILKGQSFSVPFPVACSSEKLVAPAVAAQSSPPKDTAPERPAKRDYKNRFYNKAKPQSTLSSVIHSQARPRDTSSALQPVRESAASTEPSDRESIFSVRPDDDTRRSSSASTIIATSQGGMVTAKNALSHPNLVRRPKKKVTFADELEQPCLESLEVVHCGEPAQTPRTSYKIQAGLLTPPTVSPANGNTDTTTAVSPIALNLVATAPKDTSTSAVRPLPPLPAGPPRRPLPPVPISTKSSRSKGSKEDLYNSPAFSTSSGSRTSSPLSQEILLPKRAVMPPLPLGIRAATSAPSLRVHSPLLPVIKFKRKPHIFNAKLEILGSDGGSDKQPVRPVHPYEKHISSTTKPLNFSRPIKRDETQAAEIYGIQDGKLKMTSEESITLFILQSSAARYSSTIGILQTRISHHTAEVKKAIADVQYTLSQAEADRIKEDKGWPMGKQPIKTITLSELRNNQGHAKGVQWKVPKDEIARRVRRHQNEKLKRRGEKWSQWKGERYQELCRIADEELRELEDCKRAFNGKD